MRATAVVGAQYGSEGKGSVVQELADEYDVHVRVGGPNAGHTIIVDGQTWKMQSVPCGWVNPEAILIIGAGAVVDADNLLKEVADLEEAGYDVLSRLFVDQEATVITTAQRDIEGGVEGRAHRRVGSTGKGVGAARMARINRGAIADYDWLRHLRVADHEPLHKLNLANTAALMRDSLGEANILLEGTQGSGLSLIHGTYPWVTSADVSTAQLLADTGLPPWCLDEVWLVARTHPIRVAGASGPLHAETTWEALGQPPEHTTVTGKVRRVGSWSTAQVADAVYRNGASGLWVTFLDYAWPEAADARSWSDLPLEAVYWLDEVRQLTHCQIVGVGVGPSKVIRAPLGEWA